MAAPGIVWEGLIGMESIDRLSGSSLDVAPGLVRAAWRPLERSR